jgi:hypothetical protein
VIIPFRNIVCLLLITPFLSFSGKDLKEAYKALEIHDYFKAKHLFYKDYHKKPGAASAYGLAIIFSRNNNPFHQLDSACKYATAAKHLQNSHPQNLSMNGFSTDSVSVKALLDTIAERKLTLLLPLNDYQQLNNFLIHFYAASPSIIQTVIHKRDELVFNEIKSTNSSSSTRLFMSMYPYSSLLTEAKILLQKQLYEEITKAGDTLSFQTFIRQHPGSPHISKAYRELLSIFKKTKNISGIYRFIQHYPQAPQIKEAWESLFTLSVNTYSNEELNVFLLKYPDFPFKNSIVKEMQLNKKIVVPVSFSDKTGFADTSGRIIIPALYDEADDFYEGLSLVQINDSVCFINKENQVFLNRYFQDALPFYNGMAAVKQKQNWYFINRMGERLSDYLEEINPLNDQVYVCKKNNLYGTYTIFGEPELPFVYEKLGDFKNGCAYYQKKNTYGFVTKQRYVHPAECDWISDFNRRKQAVYKKGNSFGIINSNGVKLLDALYDQILPAPGNLYLVIKNNLYGFYSAEGCFISELIYRYKPEQKPDYYTNGNLLKFHLKDKVAIADLNGKIILDFGAYQDVSLSPYEMIRVTKNNKYGFTNSKGSLIIPLKYSEAEDFTDSTAIVSSKKHMALINLSGKEIIKTENSIERTGKNLFTINNDDDEEELYTHLGDKIPYRFKRFDIYKNYLILYLDNDAIKILALP